MKQIIFNQLISFILFAIFLRESIIATIKFLEKKTFISSENVDDISILYPSITICKRHLNGLDQKDLKNKSLTIQDKMSILNQKIWKKNETIYFFSHSKMFNSSFPCNTKEGATDGGKPCSFPYIEPYQEGLQKACSNVSISYCYTR